MTNNTSETCEDRWVSGVLEQDESRSLENQQPSIMKCIVMIVMLITQWATKRKEKTDGTMKGRKQRRIDNMEKREQRGTRSKAER